MTDLRCNHKKHGVLENGYVEIKCNSQFCGARSGVVVLHRFDIKTGECIETKMYKEPPRTRKVAR